MKETTITMNRSLAMLNHRRDWRKDDPPATTVGELSPDVLGSRVVIRSKQFIGTVYGTLLAVEPHPTLTAFTTVQLYGKKLLTFRSDTEALVVDDVRHREHVYN